MKIDQNYTLTKLEELLNTPSPTGFTDDAIQLTKKSFDKLGVETKLTNKRALIATIPGESEEAITFSAHVDTLGLMVKDFKVTSWGEARILFSLIGGYAPVTIEGNYVTIHSLNGNTYTGTVLSSEQSVHTYRTVDSNTRTVENMEIRIDEEVHTIEDIKDLGIEVGDYISLDTNTVITNSGYIKSRHLDDKACVVSLLAMAKYIVDENITPKNTINFFISNYEEVGHGSASAIPKNTYEFVAVDMAAMGDTQSSRETKVTICAKDSSGPYDFHMKNKMIDLCKTHDLNYAIDIYKYYGSDASAMQRAGFDVPAIIIGPGVESSHAYERTHWKGIEETTKLCLLYANK